MLNGFKTLKNHVQNSRDFLVDIIFPVECLNCEKEGNWICGNCFMDIKLNSEENCFVCGKQNKFGEVCQNCKNNQYIDGILPAAYYTNEFLEKIIRIYKYKFIRELKVPLGQIMLGYLNNYLERINVFQETGKKISPFLNPSELIIIPVPLHRKRFLWRGFNQADELAKIISSKYNLKLDNRSFLRIRNTRSQAKLPTTLRTKNMLNSFKWTGASLKNKNILFIDDVTTSGSTLNECARMLKEAGANKIWGLVVAKG